MAIVYADKSYAYLPQVENCTINVLLLNDLLSNAVDLFEYFAILIIFVLCALMRYLWRKSDFVVYIIKYFK